MDTDLAMRWSVIAELCLMRRDLEAKLPNGCLTLLSQKYGMGERTIRTLWMNYKDQVVNGIIPDLNPQRKGNCGISNDKLTDT